MEFGEESGRQRQDARPPSRRVEVTARALRSLLQHHPRFTFALIYGSSSFPNLRRGDLEYLGSKVRLLSFVNATAVYLFSVGRAATQALHSPTEP